MLVNNIKKINKYNTERIVFSKNTACPEQDFLGEY